LLAGHLHHLLLAKIFCSLLLWNFVNFYFLTLFFVVNTFCKESILEGNIYGKKFMKN